MKYAGIITVHIRVDNSPHCSLVLITSSDDKVLELRPDRNKHLSIPQKGVKRTIQIQPDSCRFDNTFEDKIGVAG